MALVLLLLAQDSPGLRYYYPVPPANPARVVEVDLCVYGGTSGGAAAAIQAARMGKTAALVEFGRRIGGLTSGGLSATDVGNRAIIAGLADEFYKRVGKLSGFLPSEAEKTYLEMLREAKVEVFLEHRLKSVKREGNRLVEIETENGNRFRAKMFIDATYEGDLLAKAGVSFHVGREGNALYGETLNGRQFKNAHNFGKPVDPYVVEGDPASGLLKGISGEAPGKAGEGDKAVQAYNFRMFLTNGPDRLPWPKPPVYDAARYDLLARYLKAAPHIPLQLKPGDSNNTGGFSTDHIGMNYEWPEGSYETRERIFQDHVNYQQGLLWCMANDGRIPADIREKVKAWGLHPDEFKETGGWPHQLYIREGRRMVSEVVMTELHCLSKVVAEDSVGMAAYNMDSHNCRRLVIDGKVRNEGDVQTGCPRPYPISYRSIVPREAECANLLVPVCLSSSHIAYGSIRMEPVFMGLGQSAAVAASFAIDAGVPVQRVEYAKLREKLVENKQALGLSSPVELKLAGVVVDDSEARLEGGWTVGSSIRPFVKSGYRHDGDREKGRISARFEAKLKPGRYEVRLFYTAHANRATNVPVTVRHAGGEKGSKLNQRRPPPIDGTAASLGEFEFVAEGSVTISNEGTDGHVIIDAVQFLPRE